jgi:hypothetical protein
MAEPTAEERKRLFEAIADQYGRAKAARDPGAPNMPPEHFRYSKRSPGVHRGGRKYYKR